MYLSVCERGGGKKREGGRELEVKGEEWGGVIQGRKRAQDFVCYCRYGEIIIIIQLYRTFLQVRSSNADV